MEKQKINEEYLRALFHTRLRESVTDSESSWKLDEKVALCSSLAISVQDMFPTLLLSPVIGQFISQGNYPRERDEYACVKHSKSVCWGYATIYSLTN